MDKTDKVGFLVLGGIFLVWLTGVLLWPHPKEETALESRCFIAQVEVDCREFAQ